MLASSSTVGLGLSYLDQNGVTRPSEHALENPEALPSVRENPFCWVSLWSGFAEEPNLALPSDHRKDGEGRSRVGPSASS